MRTTQRDLPARRGARSASRRTILSYCTGYQDLVVRLRRHVPGYDKSRLNFADYTDGVGAASRRAKELEPTGTEHGGNPSTNVWQLVATMRESI
jgi:hypothetical protein